VSESSTDNETEEEMDPWIPLIEAKQRSNIAFEEMKESLINGGLDEQSAKDKAYSNILPKLQKELENISGFVVSKTKNIQRLSKIFSA
jgi:SPX domain protein involved in polyphosphate accumulation